MQSHDPEKDHGTIHCWKLARHRKEGRHKTFSEVSDILFLFLFFLGSVWKRSVKSYYSSLNTLLVYPFLCVSNALCKNGGGDTDPTPFHRQCNSNMHSSISARDREFTEDLEASVFLGGHTGLDFCQSTCGSFYQTNKTKIKGS